MKHHFDPDTTKTTAWIWIVALLVAATIAATVLVAQAY